MKIFVFILLTMLLAFSLCLYFPWWMVAVAGLVVALVVPQSNLKSFIGGFFGVFVLWLLLLLIINASNDGILGKRISMVMGLGQTSFLLILISSLIGAITGGLGALTGSLFRKLVVVKS